MINYVPSGEIKPTPLKQDLVMNVTNDFLGIHANRWPINQRPYITGRTATGTIGQFTITVSSVSGLPTGANVVNFDSMGVGIGAKITNINGLILTLDVANAATFTSKLVEFYYPGALEAVGSPDQTPAQLNYNWFRTHDSQWGQWRQHNPAPGVYNWTNTDAIYVKLIGEGKKILCTLIGTPKFASARPMEFWSAYGNYGGAAEPANMQYWIDYCIALATRYPLIDAYEVWNEPKFIAVPTRITTSSGTATVLLAEVLNVAATGTAAASTITLSSGNSLLVQIGGAVTGTGIGTNTVVTARNGMLITLSVANAGVVSGNMSFKSTATGVVAGGTLMSSSFPVGTTVVSVAADKITVTVSANATASGTVNASFHGLVTSFYSGSYEKLAEMTRLAHQAIKSVRPMALILNAPPSNIQTAPAWVENCFLTSDGTNITIYRTNIPVKTGEFVQIKAAGIYNTPDGVFDQVISATFGSVTILRGAAVGSSRCQFMFRLTVNEGIWSASPAGFSYLGQDGTGTRAIDWIDIFSTHTYAAPDSNSIFPDTIAVKKYLREMNNTGMEMWATEFGISFNEEVTSATVTAGSSTVTVAPSTNTNRLIGQHLLDPNGNLVGWIATNSGTTATLGSPALLTLTGGFMLRTVQESLDLTIRFVEDYTAAGFAKVFPYTWGSTTLSYPQDSTSIDTLNQHVEAIRGKKIVAVRGFKIGGNSDLLVI